MKNLLFVLFIIGTLVGCSSSPVSGPTSAATAATSPETKFRAAEADPFKAGLESFMKTHPPGEWWMERRIPADDLKSSPDKAVRSNIAYVLTTYGKTTKESQIIADAFSKFNVGFSIQTPSGPALTIDAQSHPGGKVAVVFFPLEDVPYQPSSLSYNSDHKMVMVAAVDWPPKIFAAMLMHEFYHAYRDMTGKTNNAVSDDSDEWIGEEVEAHSLEAYILNKAAGGAYFKEIDQLLVEERVTSMEGTYKVLTPSNLKKLDVVLGTQKLGQNVMNALVSQHMFVTGLRYAEKHLIKEDRHTALIKHYRTTRSQFGGP